MISILTEERKGRGTTTTEKLKHPMLFNLIQHSLSIFHHHNKNISIIIKTQQTTI